MIFGLIATRAPSSSMALSAFTELAIAVELFERGAMIIQRAKTGLVRLAAATHQILNTDGHRTGDTSQDKGEGVKAIHRPTQSYRASRCNIAGTH